MKLIDFIEKTIAYLSPNLRYKKAWHLKLISDYLEELMQVKNNRCLVVNLPPRYLKSTCISVAWPAWCLGQDPSTSIIVASYSQFLSNKHSIDTRTIIQSDWYKNLFPELQLSKEQNTKNKFATTARGFRLATSVGGTLTGEGADILIVDDPITPMQALSKTYRRRNVEWFEQCFMSRLNSRKKGIAVVVMHRLHRDDLSNHLLNGRQKHRWKHLSMPLINESQQKIYSLKKRKLLFKRAAMTPLCSDFHSMREIQELRLECGSYVFAAQYQQEPIGSNTHPIKEQWFGRYDNVQALLENQGHEIIQSWDTANSNNDKSNYSVCMSILYDGNSSYILEVYKCRLTYPQLKQKVIEQAANWLPHTVLIENKASGQQLIQELGENSQLPIIKITPSGSKIQRLYQALSFMESGKVLLPKHAAWLVDLEHELFNFPTAKQDDQVDCLTQYVLWHQKRSLAKRKISML